MGDGDPRCRSVGVRDGDASARKAVIDGVTRSLATGFVYVEHDLSVDKIDEVYGNLEAFFTLPQDNKDRYIVPGSNGQSGYTGLLVETAASADVPDWKEMLNWGAPLGEGHPLRDKYPHRYGRRPSRRATSPAWSSGSSTSTTRSRICSHGCCVSSRPASALDPRFFDEMLVDGATLTRAIHYPAMESAPGEQHVWAGEHADINLITALPRATAAGLQVKIEGDWVDAAPPDGRAIINTGLMLERLTNGAIPPGIHRVVSGEGQQGDRYSVVQFAHPTPWTMLQPVSTCVTEDRPLRYPTISAADALDKVLWEINLVEDGRRVG